MFLNKQLFFKLQVTTNVGKATSNFPFFERQLSRTRQYFCRSKPITVVGLYVEIGELPFTLKCQNGLVYISYTLLLKLQLFWQTVIFIFSNDILEMFDRTPCPMKI